MRRLDLVLKSLGHEDLSIILVSNLILYLPNTSWTFYNISKS